MKPLIILAKNSNAETTEVIFTNKWISPDPVCPNQDKHHPADLVQKTLSQALAKTSQCPGEHSSQFKWGDKTYFFQFNRFQGDQQACYILCSGYETDQPSSESTVLNQDFLMRLTDTLPDMLWAKDVNGRYLFANQAICDNLLMATKQEVVGKDDVGFALRERAKHPENLKWHTFGELCFNSDEVVLEAKKPMRFEEFGHIKGKMTYLDVHKAPFYDENGALIGTVGAGRDVTLQKELEQSLDEANKTFKVLLDASLDALIIFDENLNCIQTNENFFQLTGYTNEDVLNKHVREFYAQSNSTLLDEKLKEPDTGVYRLDVIKKDTTTVPCMIRAQNMKLFNQDVRIVALVDISELENSRHQLEKVQRIAHMGNFDWDLTTHAITASDEMYRIYGMQPGCRALKFKDLLKFVHPDDKTRVERYLMGMFVPDEELSVTYRIITENGAVKYITQNGVMVADSNNKPASIVAITMDITEQVIAQQEILEQRDTLKYQAHYDALTQLPNRTLFTDRLTHLIESGERSKNKHGLLFIDLDHFKQINDSFGHNFGDRVLIEVSKRLKSVVRQSDTLSRIGGDEFTLLLEDVNNERFVTDIISKLMEVMNEPISINGNPLYLTLSIGAAIYPTNGLDTEDLLKNADSAMYKAKEDGRNTYRFYSEEMTERAFQRLAMENSLREAIKNESFEVYYQPQYDGESESLLGMEALIRWFHPLSGPVSPAQFLPLAEETGLIVKVDQWVMKTAITQFDAWVKQGLNPGSLALNLTIKQIHHPSFIPYIKKLLDQVSFKAETIEFEVTEGQIMLHPEKAIKVLHELKSLGFRLSIDDFGTGYSSLSQLKRLPIEKLKIDQSFIRDLPDDEEDATLTKTIIGLAKNLNLSVIAEGVETQAQKDFVIEHGCSNIQGYYYSRPIPAKEMTALLEANHKN